MTTAEHVLNRENLASLAPFSILSPELLDEVIKHATIKQLPPGQRAFKAGDKDNQAVFLLSGQLALISEGRPATMLKAGTTEASNLVEDHQPRQATALASTNVTILSIDADFLEELIKRNESAIQALPSTNRLSREERISRILKIPVFSKLPRPYVNVIGQRLTILPVKAGDVILSEGDKGEYYYLISRGGACVTRRSAQSGQIIDVADLVEGQGFGEESLIINGCHNGNVTMMDDGELFRLSRGEFMTLMVRPLIKWVAYGVAATLQSHGTIILDVRMPNAFVKENIAGSVNLPLPVLRKTASILDKSRNYIVCSDNSGRSITGAFLLAFQGLNAQVLEGGVHLADA